MSIFNKINQVLNLTQKLGKEGLKQLGKEVLKQSISALAKKHTDKQYNAVLYDKNNNIVAEFIIIPKKDELVLGLVQIIEDLQTFQIGSNKIEIRPITETFV